MSDDKYKAVRIERGGSGWGGPLVIKPTAQRDKIVAVTGGGIPPLARRIAEMTGATAVDGFRAPPVEGEIAAVVIDCGGTARCGVYPRKRIPTVNLTPVGQSGPLAQFITEDIYVSGVTPDKVTHAEGEDGTVMAGPSPVAFDAPTGHGATAAADTMDDDGPGGIVGLITSVGRIMGRAVGIFFNAGRRTIDQVIRNVLPFMAFVTMLIGIILYTGIGDILAAPMGPLANNIVGLLVIAAICSLPFLSPILGPGAVIETPAAVFLAGDLAATVDFFSIGTNDLTQYVMAADRLNPKVAKLNRTEHPAVLAAIRMAARAAREAGIWIGVCGEAAARPDLIPFFLENGVTELSMSPASIPRAKKCVTEV